ncbi:MFS transporter [Litoribacterium kuwaitense]|uniref:MFS transporter n=1 Tax=Litoribacterium kuwaitense TaxID=1398745 RepID=UPI0028B1C84A|nr:MFS transporter [Litoribacterium kuwaitense]
MSQFSQPSSMKIIRQHVPQDYVQAAIAFSQALMSLFIIAGPIIGTAVYASFGITGSLISLLVIFALSGIVLSFLPKAEWSAQEVTQNDMISDFKEGIWFIQGRNDLQILLLIFSVLAFGVGLVLFLITDRVGLAKEHLQWLTTFAGSANE